MALETNKTLYQLDGIIRNSSNEVLAVMTVEYDPARANEYITKFTTVDYSLLKENFANKLTLTTDLMSFIDKAYEMIHGDSE